MSYQFFNDKKKDFENLREDKVQALYNIQKGVLMKDFQKQKSSIKEITDIFYGYTRTDALQLLSDKLQKETNEIIPAMTYDNIEKAMRIAKGKAQVQTRALQNKIDAFNVIKNAVELVTKTTGQTVGSAGNDFMQRLILANQALETISQQILPKEKRDVKDITTDITKSFNELKKFFGEYLALGWAIEKLKIMPEGNAKIEVIATGEESNKTAIRVDKKTGTVKYDQLMRESRDLTFGVTQDGAYFELGLTIKNYSNSTLKFWGITLRDSTFSSILPVLAGKTSINMTDKESVLAAFTYGFHNLKYGYLQEDDLQNLRKMMAVILFSNTYTQNDLSKAIQLSLFNDTFKTIADASIATTKGFFPDISKQLVLDKHLNMNAKQLQTIPQSINETNSFSYLARYVGLRTKLKLDY